MALSPTPPTLAIGSNGTPVTYPLVINPNTNAISTYLTNERNFKERSIGGGLTEDQIADQAILSRNLRPQKNMIQMTNTSFTLGATAKVCQQIQVTTTFDNAVIDLYVQQAFETNGPVGNYLIGALLQRSTTSTFTSSTLIVANQEESYIPSPSGFAAHFKYVKFRIIDQNLGAAGNYYYRLMMSVGLVNNVAPVGEPLTIIGSERAGNNFDYSNYIIYYVTNGFTI
jgi:hypothetical protein